ncbi:hypothetical protein [Dietzia sp. MNB45]|uniref:hypothetical protein n=1 Tax=Dietzia sp. MNB45 TaxID=3238800 RepID=UPI003F810F72
MEHVEGQAVSDSAWKATVPSRHGEPNVYYFRTWFDTFAYMPFMENYGALADITEVSASEVDKYTEHPAGRAR